jgi:hypothetical protein
MSKFDYKVKVDKHLGIELASIKDLELSPSNLLTILCVLSPFF